MRSAKPRMCTIILICISLPMVSAHGGGRDFDNAKPNQVPNGWRCGVTGKGHPKWIVVRDDTAPSRPNVLSRSGYGTFPWCVFPAASPWDGYVEGKFKPVSERINQAGVWRFKSGDQYYVARANGLENSVSVYSVQKGRRKTIRYVDAPVPRNEWNTLRVGFAGDRIKVRLNGKRYLALRDRNISGAGAVGVWTKADSKTLFDDFVFD